MNECRWKKWRLTKVALTRKRDQRNMSITGDKHSFQFVSPHGTQNGVVWTWNAGGFVERMEFSLAPSKSFSFIPEPMIFKSCHIRVLVLDRTLPNKDVFGISFLVLTKSLNHVSPIARGIIFFYAIKKDIIQVHISSSQLLDFFSSCVSGIQKINRIWYV